MQRQNHWTDFNKTWHIELHTGGHPAFKLWHRYGDRGWSGRIASLQVSFFSFFFLFFSLPRPQVALCVNDKSKRVIQTFWGSERCAHKFYGLTPQLGVVNRTFKHEWQKNQILITWKLLSRSWTLTRQSLSG